MANVTRVKVTRKAGDPNEHRAFKRLMTEFKRRVDAAKILHHYKEHQYFESKSEKRRKKKREAELRNKQETLKAKMLAGEHVNVSGRKKKKKKNKDSKGE